MFAGKLFSEYFVRCCRGTLVNRVVFERLSRSPNMVAMRDVVVKNTSALYTPRALAWYTKVTIGIQLLRLRMCPRYLCDVHGMLQSRIQWNDCIERGSPNRDNFGQILYTSNLERTDFIQLTLSFIALQLCYTSLTANLHRNNTKCIHFWQLIHETKG